VTKPQGYTQAAEEQLVWLFALCLPYWQTMLFAGMSGMIFFLVLMFLLLFVVAGSPAICRAVRARAKDLRSSWAAPVADRRDRWVAAHLQVAGAGPSLAPSFQRPPPLFS
jgi:Na+-transporting methylmalonyl-CoA/oxaloacetate decarboxylase gamma subunit